MALKRRPRLLPVEDSVKLCRRKRPVDPFERFDDLHLDRMQDAGRQGRPPGIFASSTFAVHSTVAGLSLSCIESLSLCRVSRTSAARPRGNQSRPPRLSVVRHAPDSPAVLSVAASLSVRAAFVDTHFLSDFFSTLSTRWMVEIPLAGSRAAMRAQQRS